MLALYTEIASLIYPTNTTEGAVSTLRQHPIENRQKVAEAIMASVRTNTLPSHRVEIARGIQDALRLDGLGDFILTQGLESGRDDSRRENTLYTFVSGQIETMDQVVIRLNRHDKPEDWNPNPEENKGFDWWSAIKKATIKNLDHMEALLKSFPPSEYENIEVLAWKARCMFEMDYKDEARRLAEDAISSARDASWHRWLDSAQQKIAHDALKHINKEDAVLRARKQFGNDLIAGKLLSTRLLDDITDIFDFLEIKWPTDTVCWAIDDYLTHVLSVSPRTDAFESLTQPLNEGSIDKALCRFIVHLIAFPVVDVGVAARRALAKYAGSEGNEIALILKEISCWDSVQLEHVLSCLHTASCNGSVAFNSLRDWILNLNTHDSIAVRCIARRLSEQRGWPWKEINNQIKKPVVLLPGSQVLLTNKTEAKVLIGSDIPAMVKLHSCIFVGLEDAGLDAAELRSEFHHLFLDVETNYKWADNKRLNLWRNLVLAQFWLNPRAIIGREAAMRLLGRRTLTGQAPPGAEQCYDYLYPIYDPALELFQPVERPTELRAMEWEWTDGNEKAWLNGEHADSWSDYPEIVNGLYVIGERTWLIRPDWGWPREERYRGLIHTQSHGDSNTQDCIRSSHGLTYECYLQGLGQNDQQLVVMNFEQQLIGPAYRWIAINSSFAMSLDWKPSADKPFEWIDARGNVMVQSIYWKDGWIWLEPPRSESLGEGWLVLATEEAVKIIRSAVGNAECHLWVERYSHGSKSYQGKWHLSKRL